MTRVSVDRSQTPSGEADNVFQDPVAPRGAKRCRANVYTPDPAARRAAPRPRSRRTVSCAGAAPTGRNRHVKVSSLLVSRALAASPRASSLPAPVRLAVVRPLSPAVVVPQRRARARDRPHRWPPVPAGTRADIDGRAGRKGALHRLGVRVAGSPSSVVGAGAALGPRDLHARQRARHRLPARALRWRGRVHRQRRGDGLGRAPAGDDDFASRNALLGWYLGGLNFQVEHHLFPRVCHLHYPALSRIVEETCSAHRVRYRCEPSLRSALAANWRWLRRMGSAPAQSANTELALLKS